MVCVTRVLFSCEFALFLPRWKGEEEEDDDEEQRQQSSVCLSGGMPTEHTLHLNSVQRIV